MRKVARLMLLLLLMATGVSGAAIDCSSFWSSKRPLFNVTISWIYNSTTQTCTARKLESGVATSSATVFAKDETKSIKALGNECLKFVCVYPGLFLNTQESACPSEKGCLTTFNDSKPGCTAQRLCSCHAGGYYYNLSSSKETLASHMLLLTQIVCVPDQWPGYPVHTLHPAYWPGYPGYHPAHGPGYPVYHPAHWPGYPVYHPAHGPGYPVYHPAHWPVYPVHHPAHWPGYPVYHPAHWPGYPEYHPAHWPGYPVYHPAHWPGYPVYHPAHWPGYPVHHPALAHPVTGDGFHLDGPFHWIPNQGGVFPWPAAPGGGSQPTPTPSGSGSMITPDPKDCKREGMFFKGHENSTCATFTCVKNTSTSPPEYYFQIEHEGCYYNGSCYRNGAVVLHVEGHRTVTCHLDSETGQYSLGHECKGCYVSDTCVPVGHTNTSLACKHFTCKKDEEDKFQYEVEYQGCYDPYNNKCVVDNQETFQSKNGDCSFAICEASFSGKWSIKYKTTGNCSIQSQTCTDKGSSGCLHDGTCHPVKTVLTWSKCTQFVCYSDDDSPPTWEPRATGCYGPLGCMDFGEEFVDGNTGNTYRCNYTIGGLGHKFPEFHEGCVLQDGTPVALGRSILRDDVYYGCSLNRVLMSVPVNQPAPPKQGDESCGINSVTGKKTFPSIPYYSEFAICEWAENCAGTNCTYFDKRCYGGSDSPSETRSLGDKFILDGLECVCTQDRHVYNYQSKGNPKLNGPSLCAEKDVKEAACKDPDDSTLRQWGQLWVRPDSKPLEICTCHPKNREAFCSTNMAKVINISSKKQH